MSKEQTPIERAEQFLIDKGYKGFAKHTLVKQWMVEFAQQETNAKVLEALEREVPKAFKKGQVDIGELDFDILRDKESKEYYETEVEPRYKD